MALSTHMPFEELYGALWSEAEPVITSSSSRLMRKPVRAIMRLMGMDMKAAHQYLERLLREKSGWFRREPKASGAIRLLHPPPAVKAAQEPVVPDRDQAYAYLRGLATLTVAFKPAMHDPEGALERHQGFRWTESVTPRSILHELRYLGCVRSDGRSMQFLYPPSDAPTLPPMPPMVQPRPARPEGPKRLTPGPARSYQRSNMVPVGSLRPSATKLVQPAPTPPPEPPPPPEPEPEPEPDPEDDAPPSPPPPRRRREPRPRAASRVLAVAAAVAKLPPPKPGVTPRDMYLFLERYATPVEGTDLRGIAYPVGRLKGRYSSMESHELRIIVQAMVDAGFLRRVGNVPEDRGPGVAPGVLFVNAPPPDWIVPPSQ